MLDGERKGGDETERGVCVSVAKHQRKIGMRSKWKEQRQEGKDRNAVRGLRSTVNTCHFAHVLPFRKFDSLSNFIFIIIRRDRQTVSFTENTEAQRGTVTCLGPHGKWQKHMNPGFQTQILCSFHCSLVSAKGRGAGGDQVGINLITWEIRVSSDLNVGLRSLGKTQKLLVDPNF